MAKPERLDERQQQIVRVAAETHTRTGHELMEEGDFTTTGIDDNHPEASFGELDQDYSQAEHNSSNGVPNERGPGGVGLCSSDDVNAYYDSVRRTEITILKRD